jgi:hypothetical protein
MVRQDVETELSALCAADNEFPNVATLIGHEAAEAVPPDSPAATASGSNTIRIRRVVGLLRPSREHTNIKTFLP